MSSTLKVLLPAPKRNARFFAVLLLPTLAICFVVAGHANPKVGFARGLSQDTRLTWPGKPDPKDKSSQPWLYKDWTTWNELDCGRVLSNSPWMHRTALTYNGIGNGFTETMVELRSALPVRQALLRSAQLQKHYDKMDPDKKQEFDRQHASDADSEDKVVIIVSNTSVRPPPGANAESGLYAPDPATQVALGLPDGSLIQPIQTKSDPPVSGVGAFGNQTEYVFPRTIGGKPLYSSSDSSITIRLGAPLIVDKKTRTVEEHIFQSSGAWIFHISDLIYNGRVEY